MLFFRQKLAITFEPTTEHADIIQDYPKPSVKFIPNWYKQIPQFMVGTKKLTFPMNMGMPNLTIKKCVPFLDALTTGYMMVLEDDVYVEQVDDEPFIRWRHSDDIITWHDRDQYPGVPIPETYHFMIAKWVNNWTIMVPKNYTILFSHPSNRIDLPFFTLSGLVNCGDYTQPVQFPFLLKRGFEGIIEAGTPICQLHIIKNERWKTRVLKYDSRRVYKNTRKFFGTFVGSYKKNFWVRHNYQ